MVPYETESFSRDSLIAYSPATEQYSPHIIKAIQEAFPGETYQVELGQFDDGSPLAKAEAADHVLYVTLFTGDDWRRQYAETGIIGSSFTVSPDEAGANSKQLGVFLIYYEARQDRRAEKPLTPDGKQLAVVKNQGVTTRAYAELLANVVKADYVVTIALHSNQAAEQFKQLGMEHINITLAPLIHDHLLMQGAYDGPLETMYGTVDLGNLNHIEPLRALHQLDLAIVRKLRIPRDDGTKSDVVFELIDGNVEGKRVIVMDDIGSSWGTLRNVANVYFAAGAAELVFVANHAVNVGEFYRNATELLMDPRIKILMTTNTLQFGYRNGRLIDIPYVSLNGEKREIQIIDAADTIAELAGKIAHSPDAATAKRRLGPYHWTMQKPTELYRHITGRRYEKTRVVAVYDHGEFFELPKKGDIFTTEQITPPQIGAD